jgi:hypothetical protein
MDDRSAPTHDLAAVQERVRVGFVHYSVAALDGAGELDMDRYDIHECVLALAPDDFYKTMPAERPKWSGCMQDVYRPFFRGEHLYVKLQLWPGQRVHIVSFKRKELL